MTRKTGLTAVGGLIAGVGLGLAAAPNALVPPKGFSDFKLVTLQASQCPKVVDNKCAPPAVYAKVEACAKAGNGGEKCGEAVVVLDFNALELAPLGEALRAAWEAEHMK